MGQVDEFQNKAILEFLKRIELQCVPYSIDWADRLAYSHDTSYSSLRMAWNRGGRFMPSVVIWPRDSSDVSAIMRAAIDEDVNIVAWGGGSGIVGGALNEGGATVDFKAMNNIIEIDTVSQVVHTQPGIIMQVLEDRLNDVGYTCCHHPQSMQSATLGGAIAHRGAGFKSTGYGKIEDLVLGMEVVVPPGNKLVLKGIPRHSNGPDLRHLFFGSEGAFGFITQATMQIRRIPQSSQWQSFRFPTFRGGLDGLREVMQSSAHPVVVRLFDERQTELIFRQHFPHSGGALLIVLWEGGEEARTIDCQAIAKACAANGGEALGGQPGEWWWQRRLSTAALLKTQHTGGFSDTIEVAVRWREAYDAYEGIVSAIREVMPTNSEVFGHVAHAYPTATDLYIVLHGKPDSDERAEDGHLCAIKNAVLAALDQGATLSHHHGIGLLRHEFLEEEYGPTGYQLLKGLGDLFDHMGRLNPGKLGKSNKAGGLP